MGSFHRMKEDVGEMAMTITSKFPGKTLVWILIGVITLIVFVLGFGIGFASNGSNPCSGVSCRVPVYLFSSNNTESCPALTGDKLLTTVAEGQSFEGLSVHLQCDGNYLPYPRSVKCSRSKSSDGSQGLEWSHLPVCYPSSLISVDYWRDTKHARSVVCSGSSKETHCNLHCILDYVPVEEEMYKCTTLPCPAWSINNKKCFMCQENCSQFKQHHAPSISTILHTMSCDPDCGKVVLTSTKGAAVWQNKRTGLFQFIGEHSGRPVYQKNSTKEYLYYSTRGAEWLVGPDFKTVHGGIQMFNNDDKSCPERLGGKNSSKVYIDSSEPFMPGESLWKEDDSIQVQCYTPGHTPVTKCSCTKYEVTYQHEQDGEVPPQVELHMGVFTRMDPSESFDILAPIYQDLEKNLYLFSHHPEGLVWQVSQKLTTTPLRAVTDTKSCPDTPGLVWEWYNGTTGLGQQNYVRDSRVVVQCREN